MPDAPYLEFSFFGVAGGPLEAGVSSTAVVSEALGDDIFAYVMDRHGVDEQGQQRTPQQAFAAYVELLAREEARKAVAHRTRKETLAARAAAQAVDVSVS